MSARPGRGIAGRATYSIARSMMASWQEFRIGSCSDAGGLKWSPGTRNWCVTDGTLAAQYREQGGHCALLVREDWLKRTLRKCGRSMVFGWLGEKRLFDAGSPPQLLGDWIEISAVASLSARRWEFGQRRFTRRG